MSRVVDSLPLDEQRDLQRFLANMAPVGVDAIVACWFLRSVNGNVEKAVEAYKASVAWRAAQRIDLLLQEPRETDVSIRQHLDAAFKPRLLDGLDILGRPILYMPYGGIDLVALEKKGVKQEHIVRRCEHLWAGGREDVVSAPWIVCQLSRRYVHCGSSQIKFRLAHSSSSGYILLARAIVSCVADTLSSWSACGSLCWRLQIHS